jgi:hypothetical protein
MSWRRREADAHSLNRSAEVPRVPMPATRRSAASSGAIIPPTLCPNMRDPLGVDELDPAQVLEPRPRARELGGEVVVRARRPLAVADPGLLDPEVQ